MTPNQILGDIMTNDAYRDDHEKEEKREKDDKKNSVAFKATSTKSKANQILCWLCNTLLGVCRVMPISA